MATAPKPTRVQSSHLQLVGDPVWCPIGSHGARGWRPAIIIGLSKWRLMTGQDYTLVYLRFENGQRGQRGAEALYWRKPELKGQDKPPRPEPQQSESELIRDLLRPPRALHIVKGGRATQPPAPGDNGYVPSREAYQGRAIMLTTSISERRAKAQYSSWPDPIVALKCERCGHEIVVTKRGHAGLSHARAAMRRHVCRKLQG